MRNWTKRALVAASAVGLAVTSVGLMPETAAAATRHHVRHVRHYGVNPFGVFAATAGTIAGIAAANSYRDDGPYYGSYGYPYAYGGPYAYYGGGPRYYGGYHGWHHRW